MMTKSNNSCTSQRGNINDRIWFIFVNAIGNGITQNKTAFSIGIHHLTCNAAIMPHHIARFKCRSPSQILSCRHQTHHIEACKACFGNCLHDSHNCCPTTHIKLHIFHAGWRFGTNTA